MPLFSNKKIHARKPIYFATVALLSTDEKFQPDTSVIRMSLGDQQIQFRDGEWVPETGALGEKHRENEQLTEYCEAIEEENNLLKMRLEILLDMITETTLQKNIMSQELTALRGDIYTLMKPKK